MANYEISTIKLPDDNNTYYVKDAQARADIASLDVGVTGVKGSAESGSYRTGDVTISAANVGAPGLSSSNTFTGSNTFNTAVTGVTPTATNHFATKGYVDGLVAGGITFIDFATSSTAIKALTNVSKGDMYIVGGAGATQSEIGQEWIATADIGGTADATKWQLLGNTENLKAFAYADTGTATFTPTGSFSKGTFSTQSIYSITGVGSLPSLDTSGAAFATTTYQYDSTSETLTISKTLGTWPTLDPGSLPTRSSSAYSCVTGYSTNPSWTGTEQTITVNPVS